MTRITSKVYWGAVVVTVRYIQVNGGQRGCYHGFIVVQC
jgi:hypothetical protein